MRSIRVHAPAILLTLGCILSPMASVAHVTLRPTQPLRPGGFATVNLVVPNERHVNNSKITLEVPESFLKAGGRLSKVEYPAGWQITIDKEDKPGEVYQQEMTERTQRAAKTEAEHGAKAKSEAEQQEKQILDDLRKKWIKKVTFDGGTIPPDGFAVFLLNLELPDAPGEFRFAAVQTYADGKEVSWSELVQGAEHPAATISVEKASNPMLIPYGISGLALLLVLIQMTRGSRKAE